VIEPGGPGGGAAESGGGGPDPRPRRPGTRPGLERGPRWAPGRGPGSAAEPVPVPGPGRRPGGDPRSPAGGGGPRLPRPSRPLRRPLRSLRHPAAAPLAALAAGAAACWYLYGTDPHQSGHLLPRCPFNWTTGLLCPACGGTRLVYDLLHGDPARALHENALLFALTPVMAWAAGRWVVEGLRGRRWRPVLNARAQYVLMWVALAWTLVRNVR
jgi:hypothetical protein